LLRRACGVRQVAQAIEVHPQKQVTVLFWYAYAWGICPYRN
jgi:hypothetical protein